MRLTVSPSKIFRLALLLRLLLLPLTVHFLDFDALSTQAKMRMVDCSAYAASLESESLSNFNNWLNGGIHGPVR